MIKRIPFLVMILACITGSTQINSEHSEIEQSIRTFFDGFHKQDSLQMKSVLFENANLQTISYVREKNEVLISDESISKFLKSIVSIPKEMTFKEEIHAYIIQNDDLLASVWTPYRFFVNKKLSHCGNNNFQLVKTETGWKIFSIVDTRTKEGCLD